MANNRMYLVCNVCSDFFDFAKTMGEGWYTRNESLGLDINAFFDKHDHEHALEDGTGSKQFTFVFEVNDQKVERYDFLNRKIYLKQL